MRHEAPPADPPGARARRNTISDAFRRTALRHRDRLALTFGERRWTFAELDRAADRVAAGLIAAGLGAGDRLGAFGRNSDAYCSGSLARGPA